MEHYYKEIISIISPFLSGGLGCYIGVKVSLEILRTDVDRIKQDVHENEEKLQCQVGESRCIRNRTECKKNMYSRINDNAPNIEVMRTWITAKFEELANFMGRINGNGPPS